MLRLILAALLALPFTGLTRAAEQNPPGAGEVEIPTWFAPSFLEFDEEVREAAKTGKRLLIYFGQEGCPYCRELMQVNFSQQDIVVLTRKHFVPIALDIWGDREVTWLNDRRMTEKALARELKVQFTPTILLLDEKGNTVVRLNGYYPPHRFRAALRYAAQRMEGKADFVDYLKTHARMPARSSLTEQTFFAKPPYPLKPGASKKPLLVLFEYKECASCDALHDKSLTNGAVRRELRKFDVVRLNLFGRDNIETSDGNRSESEWAKMLGVSYAPTVILFDSGRKEALRIESDIKAPHLLGALRYVSAGAHAKEANFQRFVREHLADLEKAVKDAEQR